MLKEAFSQIEPDLETKQRMLMNILAAHELSRIGIDEEPDAEINPNVGIKPDATQVEKQAASKIKVFTPLRYLLPIAACLIFAIAIFPIYSLLFASFSDLAATPPASSTTSQPSTGVDAIEPGPASATQEHSMPGRPTQEHAIPGRPTITSDDTDFLESPVLTSSDNPEPLDWPVYLPHALFVLAILVALVFTFRGVFVWRR